MKFTVIGPAYPFKGGISHFTDNLTSSLRHEHHQVHVLSWKRQYPGFLYPVSPTESNPDRGRMDAEFMLDFYNPLTWLAAARRVRRQRADKLVMNWVTPVQAPFYITIAWLVRWLTNTKVVFISHNALPHERRFFDRPLAKAALRLADTVVVHAATDAKVVAELAPRVEIISAFHPSYDDVSKPSVASAEAVRRELGLKTDVLLFFGYIREYKGLRRLLESMPEIIAGHPETTLLVVGEFWDNNQAEYRALVDKLQIGGHVVFVDGYVPDEEVGKYFAVSRVAVLPYISATQSGIAQLAYAHDVPVLASNVGGLSEVVAPGESGELFESAEPDLIADSVNRFLAQPVGKYDVTRLRAKFAWSKYAGLLAQRTLRVGIATYDYDPPIGGQGVYVQSIVKSPAASGAHLEIISSTPGRGPGRTSLPRLNSRTLGPLVYSACLNLVIRRWSNRQRLDVVHIQAGAGGCFLLRRLKMPVIATSHMLYSRKLALTGNFLYQVLYRLERATYRRCAKVIATSDLMKRDLLTHYGLAEDRIEVIYPSFDSDIFTPNDTPAAVSGRLIFVGRLDKNKRVQALIKIVEQINRQGHDLRLTVVGDGPELPALQQYIAQHQLADTVHLAGRQSGRALAELYRASSLFVLPSVYEPFGIAAVEALSCGLPVIVPGNSGLAEIVERRGWGKAFSNLPDLTRLLASGQAAQCKVDTDQVKANFAAEERTREIYRTYAGSVV